MQNATLNGARRVRKQQATGQAGRFLTLVLVKQNYNRESPPLPRFYSSEIARKNQVPDCPKAKLFWNLLKETL